MRVNSLIFRKLVEDSRENERALEKYTSGQEELKIKTPRIEEIELQKVMEKNACTEFCSGFNSLNCRFGKEEEFLSITCLCVRPSFTYQVKMICYKRYEV
ncbi:hypothetical protein L2E82_40673 [Cichorium intybus]|uniref:Uncharacterized protein n=1 Tax=Cichorium intybus TaxID=13427 RepID=A0ACB9AM13_CICIN|nr:hypothetical protein L2E82_40673 [Cichorium intybus]